MRTAFISDIHANLDALEVVLEDIKTQNVDKIVCLGDIVGYGPEPNECTMLVKQVSELTVVGNHDYAALGRMDTLGFNEYARAAAEWTTNALTPETVAFLSELPWISCWVACGSCTRAPRIPNAGPMFFPTRKPSGSSVPLPSACVSSGTRIFPW